ncbi:helix-turn-helix domain-containing protein [Plantactinospora sp. S1510]|uniref:Helix-turn-helix domain-containing protein n=1 Tax=Plantactinospora alkalitolerans TaxID=2789879 RepID=A0ABS0GUH3_9ACTN|nr:helix-turn-helix transcriptional regulator [Plantactinospora alkalitolerans]MBF9129689.1 helix-turn-helix domain-containing protein [Plantactinospora alkalitolerans]
MINSQDVDTAKKELGRKLAGWRTTRKLTQLDLARSVPSSRSTIAGVERGAQVVDHTFWARCDALLRAGGELILAYGRFQELERQFQAERAAGAARARWGDIDTWSRQIAQSGYGAVPDPVARSTAAGCAEISGVPNDLPGVAFDDMRRRTLVKWGATAAAVASTGVGRSSVAHAGRVGAHDAERLSKAAVRLYGLDYRHGGDSLWQAATAKVNDGYAMLEQGTYTGTVEGHLLKATGRVQMCAGWLALDAGEHTIARNCFTDALALARQASDREVETATLSYLALQANALARPREASRFASAAENATSTIGGPPRLGAVPQLRKAIASALMADQSGTDTAIRLARRVLDRDGDKPTEQWCTFLSPAELDGIEGTCAVELGRTTQAQTLLERAIAGYDDRYARNRALYRVRLARARLTAGAPDGAADAANEALDDLAEEVASWRVNAELEAVAHQLAAYPEIPAVAGFLARYPSVAGPQ